MRKINVEDKSQIKQLLYAGGVFGIKDDQYRSFGGFQLWWYDKQLDVCNCCASYWSDGRKRIQYCSLDRAAKTLWHKRDCLFLRSKHLPEDKRLAAIGRSVNMQ
ncbi:MAG: hypothetical protein AMJ75_12005 [Phycisphaerae bacterium SM1_79]|nr:MAG: hypothetical protein AMJ75_12005 [Phycisphaerae bacterium SM1_79]